MVSLEFLSFKTNLSVQKCRFELSARGCKENILVRENKGEWFEMMYLLGAIRRLWIHPAKFDNFKDEKKTE